MHWGQIGLKVKIPQSGSVLEHIVYDWRCERIKKGVAGPEIFQANLELLYTFLQSDLCNSLLRFIRDIKKIDGSEYPLNTICEIVLMVQMYLHENSINWHLLDHPEFVSLCNVVDNTMKEQHAQGLGVRKSSDIITLKHDDVLFCLGILGQENPNQLFRMMIYMMGLHCALHGGIEHNKLCRPGCDSQFHLEFDDRGKQRLVYKEDPLWKANQGGLICKRHNKTVYIYAASNPERCPIQVFTKYVNLLPQTRSCSKFYLRCKKKPSPSVWYCDQPYG